VGIAACRRGGAVTQIGRPAGQRSLQKWREEKTWREKIGGLSLLGDLTKCENLAPGAALMPRTHFHPGSRQSPWINRMETRWRRRNGCDEGLTSCARRRECGFSRAD
jgi:hypothetical protein